MIRDLNLSDLVALEQDAKFPLPNLNSPLYCIKKSVILDERLVASLWVKLTSEVSIVLNSKVPKLTQARAIKEAEFIMIQEGKRLGLDDTHLFIKSNPDFTNFLMKHLKFKYVPDETLVRRF
jgi:hypothetical protein